MGAAERAGELAVRGEVPVVALEESAEREADVVERRGAVVDGAAGRLGQWPHLHTG